MTESLNFTAVALSLSLGIAVASGSYSIASITSRAMEAIGRQPEAAKDINSAMLLPCMLIEGLSLIGAVLCFASL